MSDAPVDVLPLVSDLSLLRNAVTYSTAARAFAAENLIRMPLEALDQMHLGYVVADAYSHQALAMEDNLGWFFALLEWDPKDGDKCLLACLDRARVGIGRHSEERAIKILGNMSLANYRALLRIPPDEELLNAGFSSEIVERLATALPRQLHGLQKVAELRNNNLRGLVEGYNKIKHQLIAVPTDIRGPRELFIPKWHSYDAATHFMNLKNAVWITVDVTTARLLAARAIVAQATLNSMLGLILTFYFGHSVEAADWVVRAYHMPIGWANDPFDDRSADMVGADA